jgi:hypothetical protein
VATRVSPSRLRGGGDAGKQELDEVSAASGVREINVFLFRVG